MVSKYHATISGTSNILEFLYIVIKVNKLVTLSRFLKVIFIIFQLCVHVWVFTCQYSCLRLPEVLDSLGGELQVVLSCPRWVGC